MARYHAVPNLQRRGNIWYWRPRLPRHISQTDLNQKLSFSLRQSDHDRARYMALRLNTLLAGLKFRRPCAPMTKDKLKRLFQAELKHIPIRLK